MYYEEKIIDGVLCVRYNSNAEFEPLEPKEFTRMVVTARETFKKVEDVLEYGFIRESTEQDESDILSTHPCESELVGVLKAVSHWLTNVRDYGAMRFEDDWRKIEGTYEHMKDIIKRMEAEDELTKRF